ncbi:MAG: hypothetical protein M3P04_11880 [Actinomycetota bacterium]|nr:hypothetical protein [Actinomycetota bacterium]
MRFTRPAICVVAVASAIALTAPSDAAPTYKAKTLALADDKGDANGLNDQGLGLSDSSLPAAGYDGYDIVKLDYKGTGTMTKKGRIYVPKCTGFTVKMTFAAAPGPQSVIRVTGTGVVNDALWWLQYNGTRTTLRYGHSSDDVTGSTDDTIDLKTPAKVEGSSITWTVLESDVKASGEKLLKFTAAGIGASVRTNASVPGVGGATVPQWDAIPEGDASFKAC